MGGGGSSAGAAAVSAAAVSAAAARRQTPEGRDIIRKRDERWAKEKPSFSQQRREVRADDLELRVLEQQKDLDARRRRFEEKRAKKQRKLEGKEAKRKAKQARGAFDGQLDGPFDRAIREERREDRHERQDERREDRHERMDERREDREERREERHEDREHGFDAHPDSPVFHPAHRVHILISPGHGHGWVTWAPRGSSDSFLVWMLTYEPLVRALENRAHKDKIDDIIDEFHKEAHRRYGIEHLKIAGAKDIEVREVDYPFEIRERDGIESIEDIRHQSGGVGGRRHINL